MFGTKHLKKKSITKDHQVQTNEQSTKYLNLNMERKNCRMIWKITCNFCFYLLAVS